MNSLMLEHTTSPFHNLPSRLFEDGNREAATLLQRVARGDGAAMVELHETWGPVLLGIACRMLGDRRLAHEVLRKVFARARRSAASHDPRQTPAFVWMFTMLRDEALDCLRREKNPRRSASAPDRNEAPAVLGVEDARRLKNALDLLDAESRMALEQAVFLDFSNDTSPTASLKTRLRLALETVRTQLSRHEL